MDAGPARERRLMACNAVGTGQRFVAEMLTHIDCQAQTIGAYGYDALADPGSPVSLALTALLTIFVAIFGFRLILGSPITGRDLVADILKLGIVLTLATSWPAWRTLGYDLVLNGPAELANAIGGAAGLPGSDNGLIAQLQAIDDGIVLLTVYGTGRNTGGINRSDTIGDTFRGVALADQEGLANGRLFFLAGVIAPLAIVKLSAGLLLALAPLMAGLLLFVGTRDLFLGWVRGLFLAGIGALALAAVYGVELAILGPWVRNAVALRETQFLTPSAPTELSAITLAFAVASFGILGLIAKIAFFGGLGLPKLVVGTPGTNDCGDRPIRTRTTIDESASDPTRAYVIAEAVSRTLRRESIGDHRSRSVDSYASAQTSPLYPALAGERRGAVEPLGTSYRGDSGRSYRRTSVAAARRDRKV